MTLSSSFCKEQCFKMFFFLNLFDADNQGFVQLGAGFRFLRREEAETDFIYYLFSESTAMGRPISKRKLALEGSAAVTT